MMENSILVWVQARLYFAPKFGDVYGAFPSVASRVMFQWMDGKKKSNENERQEG